nr:hypothetical protein [Acidiferrobacterales bacterium]
MHSLLQLGQRRSNTLNLASMTRLFAICTLVGVLTSCASTPAPYRDVDVRDVGIEDSDTVSESEQGNPLEDGVLIAEEVDPDTALSAERAEYYQQQALNQNDVDQRIDATLSSAEYYIQAKQPERAVDLVMAVSEDLSTKTQVDRANIVLAYADYANGYYQSALQRLEPLLNSIRLAQSRNAYQAENPVANDDESSDSARRYLPNTARIQNPVQLSTQQVDALLLSSFNYQAMGDHVSAIDALIQREAALYGAARAETTRYIWQVINAVPAQERQFI